MDLDPEGIFRDDSDEDEDNVQVRTGWLFAALSPLSFPPFIYLFIGSLF